MTAPNRPLAEITDAELRRVAHMTLRDMRDELGVGCPQTVKRLMKERGIEYRRYRNGEIPPYKTKAPYHRKKNGASQNIGVRYIKLSHARMTPEIGHVLGLCHACPDFGTPGCVECEHGAEVCRDDCDFDCGDCLYEDVCPCSRVGWEKRQCEDIQNRSIRDRPDFPPRRFG